MQVPPEIHGFKLRAATEADLPQIVAIYNSTVPSRMVTADTDPVTLESRLPWFRAHDPKTRPIWVLAKAGVIGAWLSFSSFYGRPAYQATAEISVYVDANYRRRSLGRLLLTKALEQAPNRGIHTLLGFIFGHNEPSLRLFENFGFERWAHLPHVAILDGIERDLIIVGKRIVPLA